MSEPIPLARPEIGRGRRSWWARSCARAVLSLGPMQERFEREFAAWLGVEDAVAVSSGTAGLHLGVRALGWGEGRRGPDQPLQLRRFGELPAVRAGAASLLRRRARHPQYRPGRRRGRVSVSAPRGSCRSTSSASPRRWPRSRGWLNDTDSGCSRTPARPWARSTPRASGSAPAGNIATFGFYANKQMTTGEGGVIVPSGPAVAERLRSERNQGRATNMGWLEHQGLGFNYRLGEVACAIGVAQVERLDALLEARAAAASRYAAALDGVEGVDAPIADRGTEKRSWFVYPVSLPAGSDREGVIEELARRGVVQQGLSALHPPIPPPARAGLPGGPVPGRRGSRRSLTGPALLPVDHRGVRSGASARLWPPPSARRAARRNRDNRRPCPDSTNRPTPASGGSTARSSSTGGWRPTTSTSRGPTPGRCWRWRS